MICREFDKVTAVIARQLQLQFRRSNDETIFVFYCISSDMENAYDIPMNGSVLTDGFVYCPISKLQLPWSMNDIEMTNNNKKRPLAVFIQSKSLGLDRAIRTSQVDGSKDIIHLSSLRWPATISAQLNGTFVTLDIRLTHKQAIKIYRRVARDFLLNFRVRALCTPVLVVRCHHHRHLE